MAEKDARLDKYVAESAGITRKEAKTALTKGRVQVNGEVCKIYRAEVVEGVLNSRKPAGTVLPESGLKTGIWVQCGEGILKLTQLQLPSSKVLSAQDFWNGRKIKAGDCFKNELKIEIQEPTIIVESESKEKK